MTGSIRFDESAWPLVVITFCGVVGHSQFERYIRRLDGLFDRQQRFATILDACEAGVSPPAQRRRQVDWLEERRPEVAAYSSGIAFAASNPKFRFVLSGIFLIAPLPVDHVVCSSLGEARAWAEMRLVDLRGAAIGSA